VAFEHNLLSRSYLRVPSVNFYSTNHSNWILLLNLDLNLSSNYKNANYQVETPFQPMNHYYMNDDACCHLQCLSYLDVLGD
jgi:hypothetical protein